jgi:hypothetical protein
MITTKLLDKMDSEITMLLSGETKETLLAWISDYREKIRRRKLLDFIANEAQEMGLYDVEPKNEDSK